MCVCVTRYRTMSTSLFTNQFEVRLASEPADQQMRRSTDHLSCTWCDNEHLVDLFPSISFHSSAYRQAKSPCHRSRSTVSPAAQIRTIRSSSESSSSVTGAFAFLYTLLLQSVDHAVWITTRTFCWQEVNNDIGPITGWLFWKWQLCEADKETILNICFNITKYSDRLFQFIQGIIKLALCGLFSRGRCKPYYALIAIIIKRQNLTIIISICIMSDKFTK